MRPAVTSNGAMESDLREGMGKAAKMLEYHGLDEHDKFHGFKDLKKSSSAPIVLFICL